MANINYKELIEEIRTGNRELALEFVEKTRLYIVNTCNNFTCDENKAIDIANKVYRKILLTEDAIAGETPELFINSLIEEEIFSFFKNIKFGTNENIKNKYSEETIKENLDKYYDSPAVESSITGILSTLSESERLLFLAKNIFNKNVKDIAKAFNLTELVVISEINSAENKIEENSNEFYKKYKVQIDFSKISAMKGIIGKYKTYLNLNIESILIGRFKKKVKDIYVDKDEEKEKKPQSFKEYVEGILLGKIDGWFRKRTKEAIISGITYLTSTGAEVAETTVSSTAATSTASASVATGKVATTAAVATGAAKAGVVGKVIGGVALATVVGTGGYVAVNEIVTNNEVKRITESTTPIIEEQLRNEDSSIKVYSEDGESLDVITVNYVIDKDEIDTKILAAGKAAAVAISGVSLDYTEEGNSIYINASVDRNKINEGMINKIKSLDFVTPEVSNLIDSFMEANIDDIYVFLGKEPEENKSAE